jgi:hypothetical protein
MIKIAMSAALVLLLNVPAAQAVLIEGNELYESCEASDFRWVICMGYVAGVADTLETDRAAGGDAPKVCIPTQGTRGQVIDVVKLYLERNPQERHLAAAVLVTKALVAAFPCR